MEQSFIVTKTKTERNEKWQTKRTMKYWGNMQRKREKHKKTAKLRHKTCFYTFGVLSFG